MEKIGVIRGDKRMEYLCRALDGDGFDAVMFDNKADADCDTVILPIGMDGSGMRAGYVFATHGDNVINYAKSAYFKARNALPTAEGAIQIMMENTDFTVSGCKCAVLGYGCCGKAIVDRLILLNADVTAVARNETDRAIAENRGAKSLGFDSLEGLDASVIFNTVPSRILTQDILRTLSPKTLIIDIASLPGGVDFESAGALGLKTIHALGIPGKYAPKTAGEVLKDTVLSLLRGVK